MCVCLATLIQSRLSPCGHVFCASCLVSWFSVAQEVNEDPYEERRTGLVRRKKVCPSCRAQIVSPPLELWALKDVLAAIHNYRGTAPSTNEIQQSLWDGLFNPTTFYHVIRDQDDGVLRCGMCSSEILEGQCTNREWYVHLQSVMNKSTNMEVALSTKICLKKSVRGMPLKMCTMTQI